MELVHRYYHDLYFESAAMILALITVGKYLRPVPRENQRSDYEAHGSCPKTAVVERDGTEYEIPVEQVQTGIL